MSSPERGNTILIEAALTAALRTPGIKVYREDFLRKELSKHFDQTIVEEAINTNPARAGINITDLKRLANACINYETNKVTIISTAAGVPGGAAMAVTAPLDIAQFFVHVLIILQKLTYLYGWQEIFDDKADLYLNDETFNELIIFIGVMVGVGMANKALLKIAGIFAIKTEKTLIKKALTKGTIYPIIKRISKAIGVKMSKPILAKSVSKAIPVVGAVVSGGVTFVSYKPMAKRLQKYLETLPMADVDFYKEQPDSLAVIEVDFSDIIDEDDLNDE